MANHCDRGMCTCPYLPKHEPALFASKGKPRLNTLQSRSGRTQALQARCRDATPAALYTQACRGAVRSNLAHLHSSTRMAIALSRPLSLFKKRLRLMATN